MHMHDDEAWATLYGSQMGKLKWSADWISWAEWGAIAIFALLAAICAVVTGVPVSGVLRKAVILALLLPLWPLFVWRFGSKGALIGDIPAKLCAATATLSVIQYYAAMTSADRPPFDHTLILMDHAMGFDWLVAREWLTGQPLLWQIASLAYQALLPELGIVLLTLAIVAPDRARCVVTALILSLAPTLLIFWLVPADGPFGVYGINDGSGAATGTQHYLMARAYAFTAIPLDNLQGIIAFPSFHACSAVLMTYLMRGVRIMFPAALVLNSAMIAATPVIGGHYLTDVIAGIVVAGATIILLMLLDRARIERPAGRGEAGQVGGISVSPVPSP